MADRVTQVPVEIIELPSDAKARTTQVPVEIIERPSDAKARTTQLAVEVLIRVTKPELFYATVIS